MLDKALSFGGWPGFILLFTGNIVGVLVWLSFLVRRKNKEALLCLIILFPFTFYAGRALGIVSNYSDDLATAFDQRLGPTTLLIAFLGIIMLFRGQLRRPNNRAGRLVEMLMWGFSISVTASQLATREFWPALLLSFGAGWQFLIFFYLLISLLDSEQDVLHLLQAIFAMSLLNIAVRVIAKGEPLILNPSSAQAGADQAFGAAAGRLGSGALGLAASYSGYLAILITLGLGVLSLTQKKRYIIYVLVISIELLNTFTRGGILVVTLLGLLVFFRSTRRTAVKIIFVVLLLAIPLSGIFTTYLNKRGFSLDFSQIDNFTQRIELYWLFIDNYTFPFWGTGILNRTAFQLSTSRMALVENAYIDVLESGGVLPLLFFFLITIYSVYVLIRLCQSIEGTAGARPPTSSLIPFFLVASIQWIVFANTTSTSVMAYFPYEGMAIFWTVCFSAAVYMNIRNSAKPAIRPKVALHKGNQAHTSAHSKFCGAANIRESDLSLCREDQLEQRDTPKSSSPAPTV